MSRVKSTFEEFDELLSKRPGGLDKHRQMVNAWKRKWGYLEPEVDNPLDTRFAKGVLERFRQRQTVDRTAAGNQISAAATYTAQRREKLMELTGNYYLAGEYGLEAAKDKTENRRGIRKGHEDSTAYLRSGGAEEKPVHELFKELLKRRNDKSDAKIPFDGERTFFINSPQVVDRLKLLYGDKVIPPFVCTNPDCQEKTAKGRVGKAGSEPTKKVCEACDGALVENTPKVEKLASGVYVLVCELNPNLKKDLFGGDKSPSGVMGEILNTIGTSPSSFQAYKSVHEADSPASMSPTSLDNGRKLTALQRNKGLKALKDLRTDHPAHSIAAAAAALTAGLNDLPVPATTGPAPVYESKQAEYEARLKAVKAKMDLVKEVEGIAELAEPLAVLKKGLVDAEGEAKKRDYEAALVPLAKAEEALKLVLKGRFERDPLVKDALQNIDTILAVMPSYVNDTPRFTQLFDLMTEELHLVLSRSKPYQAEDFKAQAKDVLQKRAPSIKALDPSVAVKPFLVSSGMDALTTGFVAARKAAGDDSEFQLHNPEGNYFEVKFLLDHSKSVKDVGNVVVANLNPSTPTEPPSTVENVIEHVVGKLGAVADAKPINFVLDVTVEKGGDGDTTDLDKVFANPAIKDAINAGKLNVVLCKSYQKYATFGTGKVMAGNVTVISKGSGFENGTKFVDESEQALDFMNNDESQLMTHMVEHSAKQEVEMLNHAAANAKTVSQMAGGKWETFNDGLPFLLAPLGETAFGDSGNKVNVLQLLQGIGIENRESFSFQNSSGLMAGEHIRINTGQESEEGLVEKFYAVSSMVLSGGHTPPKATVSVTDVSDKITADIDAAAEKAKAFLDSDPGKALLAKKRKSKADLLDPLTRADNPAAKLKALDEILAPSADIKQEDINQIMDDAQKDGIGKELGHINNLIASSLLMSGAAFDMKSPEAAPLRELQDQFIEAGMSRVTPETRAKLVSDALSRTLSSPELRADPKGLKKEDAAAAVAKVKKLAAALPYAEDKAKAFVNLKGFDTLPAETKTELTKVLFDGLDVGSKTAIAQELVKGMDTGKINACLRSLEQTYADATAGKTAPLKSETVSSSTLAADAQAEVPPMSPKDLTDLKRNIREVKLKLHLRNDKAVQAATADAVAAEIFADDPANKTALTDALKAAKTFLDKAAAIKSLEDIAPAQLALTEAELKIAAFKGDDGKVARQLLTEALAAQRGALPALTKKFEKKKRLADAAGDAATFSSKMTSAPDDLYRAYGLDALTEGELEKAKTAREAVQKERAALAAKKSGPVNDDLLREFRVFELDPVEMADAEKQHQDAVAARREHAERNLMPELRWKQQDAELAAKEAATDPKEVLKKKREGLPALIEAKDAELAKEEATHQPEKLLAEKKKKLADVHAALLTAQATLASLDAEPPHAASNEPKMAKMDKDLKDLGTAIEGLKAIDEDLYNQLMQVLVNPMGPVVEARRPAPAPEKDPQLIALLKRLSDQRAPEAFASTIGKPIVVRPAETSGAATVAVLKAISTAYTTGIKATARDGVNTQLVAMAKSLEEVKDAELKAMIVERLQQPLVDRLSSL
jgi:hypothetical protein